MGHDSVVGQVGGFVSEGLKEVGKGAAQLFGLSQKPEDPPMLPEAPPDPAMIRQAGLKNQMSNEQAAFASRTLFTGGSGLLDKPTTASQVLLGS